MSFAVRREIIIPAIRRTIANTKRAKSALSNRRKNISAVLPKRRLRRPSVVNPRSVRKMR